MRRLGKTLRDYIFSTRKGLKKPATGSVGGSEGFMELFFRKQIKRN